MVTMQIITVKMLAAGLAYENVLSYHSGGNIHYCYIEGK